MKPDNFHTTTWFGEKYPQGKEQNAKILFLGHIARVLGKVGKFSSISSDITCFDSQDFVG